MLRAGAQLWVAVVLAAGCGGRYPTDASNPLVSVDPPRDSGGKVDPPTTSTGTGSPPNPGTGGQPPSIPDPGACPQGVEPEVFVDGAGEGMHLAMSATHVYWSAGAAIMARSATTAEPPGLLSTNTV